MYMLTSTCYMGRLLDAPNSTDRGLEHSGHRIPDAADGRVSHAFGGFAKTPLGVLMGSPWGTHGQPIDSPRGRAWAL